MILGDSETVPQEGERLVSKRDNDLELVVLSLRVIFYYAALIYSEGHEKCHAY